MFNESLNFSIIDADEKSIGFFKIQDKQLAFEYGLESLPALVYYRKKIPIVYTGREGYLRLI